MVQPEGLLEMEGDDIDSSEHADNDGGVTMGCVTAADVEGTAAGTTASLESSNHIPQTWPPHLTQTRFADFTQTGHFLHVLKN